MGTEEHRKATSSLRLTVGELSELADAAYLLGNERLGKRLSHHAACIQKSAEAADKAYGDMIGERFNESRAATSAVFNALRPFAVEMKGFTQTTLYLCKDPQGQATLLTIDVEDFNRAAVLYKKGLAEEIDDRTVNPSN